MISALVAAVILAATSMIPQPPRPAPPPAVWMAIALHQGGNTARVELGEGKDIPDLRFADLNGKEACRQIIRPGGCDVFDSKGSALFSWTLQSGRLYITLHAAGPVRVQSGGE